MQHASLNRFGTRLSKMFIPAVLLVSLSLAGCTTTRHATFTHPKDNTVKIFMTKLPGQPYEEVAFIEVFGSVYATKQRLMHRLKLRAEQLGCDAVVNVEYKYTFWYPILTGTAVKLK